MATARTLKEMRGYKCDNNYEKSEAHEKMTDNTRATGISDEEEQIGFSRGMKRERPCNFVAVVRDGSPSGMPSDCRPLHWLGTRSKGN